MKPLQHQLSVAGWADPGCWVAPAHTVKIIWAWKVLPPADGHSSSVLTEGTNI